MEQTRRVGAAIAIRAHCEQWRGPVEMYTWSVFKARTIEGGVVFTFTHSSQEVYPGFTGSTTGRVGTAEIRQRYNDATPNKQLRGFFTFGRCNNCHPHDCAAALRASYAVLSAANSSPPVEPPLVDRLLCRCSVLLSGCKRFASL